MLQQLYLLIYISAVLRTNCIAYFPIYTVHTLLVLCLQLLLYYLFYIFPCINLYIHIRVVTRTGLSQNSQFIISKLVLSTILFCTSTVCIMAFLFLPLFIFVFTSISNVPHSSNAAGGNWPPSPGYWPSSKVRSMRFYQGYRNLWGPSHQKVDNSALTIWLDSTSGYAFFLIM